MLDHRFVEFVATIPQQLKLKRFQKKYLLRKALRKLLPSSVLDRPKKGFSVPIHSWFRGPLKSMAYEVLLSSKARKRGYFHMQRIEQLLDEHCRQGVNRQSEIWNLLMFELWHLQYMDGEPSPHRL
jgi:asparagine synthase (glutamine-hydrolysing)